MIIAETERILLRHFHIVDLDAMAELFADAEVMRYGAGPRTREWTQGWLKGCLEDYYQKWGFGLWAVVLKSERRVAGYCGLTRFDDIDGQAETELGYRLSRAYWGQGLATEAARGVRDYAFRVLNLDRLIALVDPQNLASLRVAEKTGMRFEKCVVFRGKSARLLSMHPRDAVPDPASVVSQGSSSPENFGVQL